MAAHLLAQSAIKPAKSLRKCRNHANPHWLVPGQIIYAYHRTRNLDHVYNICYDKFYPGGDSLYGAGFYASYTLAAQDRPRMRRLYGNYVLRLAIDLTDYLILDKTIARRRQCGTPLQQLQRKRIKIKSFGKLVSWADMARLFGYQPNSARLLKSLVALVPQLRDKMAGVVFTGDQDGPVVLAYDLTTVRLVDYARFDRHTAIDQLIWQPFAAEVAAQQSVDRTMQRIGRLPLPVAQQEFHRTVSQLSRRQRQFLLHYLSSKPYRALGRNQRPFIAWLLSAASDEYFHRLFYDVLHSPQLPRRNSLGSYHHQGFLEHLVSRHDFNKNVFTMRLANKCGRILYPNFYRYWHAVLRKFFQQLLQPTRRAGLGRQLRQMVRLVMDYLLLACKLFPLISQRPLIKAMGKWLHRHPEFSRLSHKWQVMFRVGLDAAIFTALKEGRL